MSNNKTAPSILAVDCTNFASELKRIEKTSAEYVRTDTMDGQFVSNISLDANVMTSMREHSRLVSDCHPMVVNSERYVNAFAQAGIDIMIIHAESTFRIHGALQKIKAASMKAGVVISPGAPVLVIESVLSLVDQVFIMTTNPEFGGQTFILEMLEKVAKVTQLHDEKGYGFDIEVDGGVDNETIKVCYDAGANVFVAGSHLFKVSDLTAQVEILCVALND